MDRASGIQAIEFVLTAGCNLRCSYCYQNAKHSGSLDWKKMRPALDLLLGSAHRRPHVIFHGGEPLLKLALIKRTVKYVQDRIPPGKRIRYSLTTNGTLLSSGVAAFLATHHIDTQLSFDGVPAAQENRHPGTFHRVEAALDRMHREQPGFFQDHLSVAITLTPANLPWFCNSVDYLFQKDVRRIRVSPLLTYDPTWHIEKFDELDREWGRVFESSLMHYHETARVPVELFRRTEDETAPPRRKKMCGIVAGDAVTVDVDGRLNGCAVFVESFQTFESPVAREAVEQMRIGTLSEGRLPERMRLFRERVGALALFGAPRLNHSGYGRCRDCRYVDSCSVCPSSIGRIPGNSDPHRIPDHICAFNLVTSRYRDMFPRQKSGRQILMEVAAEGAKLSV